MDKDLNKAQTEAVNTLPGAAVDIADNCQATPEDVKDYTKELNNNPRNND